MGADAERLSRLCCGALRGWKQEGSLLHQAARLPHQLLGSQPTVVSPGATAQPAKASRDLFRWAKELKQTVQQVRVCAARGVSGRGTGAGVCRTRQAARVPRCV